MRNKVKSKQQTGKKRAILFLSLMLAGTYLFNTCSNDAAARDLKMLCYAAYPNPYINDHAADIKKIYDGLFFSIGSWDAGVLNALGLEGIEPGDPFWKKMIAENLTALKREGVTENFLTVSFGANEPYPSPQTILSDSFTAKMKAHFSAIGKAAKELGFCGVCIDTEYPYPRYEVDHEIYTFENYTAEELMAAAKNKGRETMSAILGNFPDAVIFQLPGTVRSRPLERQYILGMIECMAERNAPGGFHVGAEYTYCMHDPVTDLATTRFETVSVSLLLDQETALYWKEKCTIAPGIWPLHMIETGGQNYPQQPWKDEIADLNRQLSILRLTTPKYIWSYSGNPLWYLYSDEVGEKYGLRPHNLKREDIDIRDWHQILKDRPVNEDPRMIALAGQISKSDRGELNPEQFCDVFGTPARWCVLGLLSNPNTQPNFSAKGALLKSIDTNHAHFGRDTAVRWFAYGNYDPRGITDIKYIFDWQNTDSASAHFVSYIHMDKKQKGYLHVGWDDGIIIYLDNKMVFDEGTYPKRGKGMLFRDRYQFEKKVPITLGEGRTRLSVNSINSHGSWLFSLRITDENDMPFENIRFRLE
jgi:hypothetical protein